MKDDITAQSQPLVEPKWLLPVIDVVMTVVAFILAYMVRYQLQILLPVFEVNRAPFEPYLPQLGLYAVLLFLSYQGSRLYKSVRGRSLLEEVYIIVNGVTSATVLMMAISFATQPLVFSRLMLIYVAAITILLLSLVRVVRRAIYAYLRTRGIGVQRVLVVGAGEFGRAVLRTMLARKELGYQPVGYLAEDTNRATPDIGRIKALGPIESLAQVVRDHRVDTVIITLPWAYHDRILKLINTCQDANVDVQVVPDFFQLNLRQVQVENLNGIPLFHVNNYAPFPGINRLVKRALDVGLIVLASPLLLLIFAAVALAIRLEGPGPIFYVQRRVGENGREFNMVKFRSMVPNAAALHAELMRQHGEDPRLPKIKNDPRITSVGRFLRKTSVDELPNLVNVLRGQMSLVGPRPPVPEEVQYYEPWHMQRLSIMPGMTGLWQVSGRSDVPFDEMCLLDIYYIENWSVKMDAQILMMTIPRVLLRQGAY